MRIPLADLHAQHESIRPELDAAMAAVVDHGRFVGGPEIGDFEKAFAAYCGVPYCVAVSNGTDAIELALRASGVGPGDEVVTTALTFIATVEAIVAVGAEPVLVDPELDTGLIGADRAEAAVTARTAALLPVHLYGQAVDMDAFRALADRRSLLLLEDAAQAHGAAWDGARAGSVGDAATFSFFPGKNLGAFGDAGCVVTSDGELAARVRSLSDHGRVEKYRHDEIGANRRLDTLQAAVLAVKLRHLEGWNESRRRHAAAYDAAFAEMVGVDPIRADPRATCVYHQYVIRVAERDRALELLRERGIGAGIHYPIPLNRQPALADRFGSLECPNAERLAAEILSLPIYPEMTDADRESVVAAVAEHAAVAPLVTQR